MTKSLRVRWMVWGRKKQSLGLENEWEKGLIVEVVGLRER
jgi:hypothetical protein